MTEISYVVVGDSSRTEDALNLAEDLGASLALDKDRRWGPGVNHMRAWILGNTSECDWIVVVEDDAILCTDFLLHAEKALEDAPTPLVSFYLGTNYPSHLARKAKELVEHAEKYHLEWVKLYTLNHAVCVAIQQTHVDDMLDYVSKLKKRPIDEAITEWAQRRRIEASYPTVSLVDHRDETPVIQQQERSDTTARTLPRRALRFRG
ncbi:n-acetylglucosaminyltransferase [Gordonia phage Forza]|uniref:N-acetylglucosaminyltransferase n=1 Tax=Gordonia phage Forza TaxID=2571247 RepID=A0A650EY44_9CAUD|nr:glucosyltransferase [Gordonia phage Forza]QEM41561.1 n-acetylglucosaminyltransferase [Gordonia phage Boopy]QGT55087.1 n-acetylglucosaminyltransferase [Gordonia phage Forza]UXE04235.1 n-acetylglucoseaminyltransferase [Gordonia phage BlueNGold]WBF03875.1 glycosyltransferase [Gordonia phage Mareelih]